MDGKLNISQVLSLRFHSSDLGRDLSIREYLVELLIRLWDEGESFSGKRPLGNSGWEWDLYVPLIRDGLIKGELDEGGYIEDCDEVAGRTIIREAISELSKEHP